MSATTCTSAAGGGQDAHSVLRKDLWHCFPQRQQSYGNKNDNKAGSPSGTASLNASNRMEQEQQQCRQSPGTASLNASN
eukprot:1159269-Pelagomonas_calceolata.AAC.1